MELHRLTPNWVSSPPVDFGMLRACTFVSVDHHVHQIDDVANVVHSQPESRGHVIHLPEDGPAYHEEHIVEDSQRHRGQPLHKIKHLTTTIRKFYSYHMTIDASLEKQSPKQKRYQYRAAKEFQCFLIYMTEVCVFSGHVLISTRSNDYFFLFLRLSQLGTRVFWQ